MQGMFYDETAVKLRAGNGGDGCASFRREKFLPKGGPDGGDGGKGGDVVLEGDENTGDLRTFHFKGHWDAKHGHPGMSRHKSGASGADCVLKVPCGLVVHDLETGMLVAEVLEHGQRVILLRGGGGGLGNLHFKSSTHQAPREFTPGKPGETGEFRFVLKSVADVGLVGFPNAGKSSLIGLLTKARPKAASYPFTTLHPNLGIIEYPDRYERLRLADIPGLIEGAHANRGLGHRFLRHIERCPVLLLILDMAGEDGRDPCEDYAQLREELRLYDPAVAAKPHLVAANKMDVETARENLPRFRERHPVEVWPISCLSEEGIPALKEALRQAIKKM
jgi:GTPase